MRDLGSAERRRFDWRWVLSRTLLALPLLQLWVSLTTIAPPIDSDYNILYTHAEMARAGESLYWEWPDYGPHYGTDGLRFPQDRVFYPPFLTPILSLITGWGVTFFAYAWTLLLWAAYWAYAATLARLAQGRATFLATIGWGVALFVLTARASQSAINLGNVDPLLWAAFGAALAYPAVRGFGLMAISLIKLWGAWPLLFALTRGEWRTIRSALLTFAAASGLVALILGPTEFAAALAGWFQHMLPVAGQGTFNTYNVSISFALLRAGQWLGWEYTPGPLPVDVRLFLTCIGIAAPLLVGWATRNAEARAQYAIVACVAVFFGPLAWNFYTPILLAPIAIIIGHRNRGALERELRAPPPAGMGRPEPRAQSRWVSGVRR